MNYCGNCGTKLEDDFTICPECSMPVIPEPPVVETKSDNISIGYGILGCIWPLLGLILFLVWRKSTPLRARSAGIGAAIGVVFNSILYLIYVCYVFAEAFGTL